MRCWARFVSLCRIYFICKKVAIDFCCFFLSYWRYCSQWNYEIKNIGYHAQIRENAHFFRCRASPERNLSCYTCTTARLSALRENCVQCNTEESPYCLNPSVSWTFEFRIKIRKMTTPHNEPLGRLWYHRSQTGSRSNFSSHQVDIVFVFSDTHKA